MPDRLPPSSTSRPNGNGAELPPRLLAKLKVEIEGYELLERLGEGGQATVYKAIQKQDGRMVAVKVLHAGPHATEEARARLKRETAALRAINHPNIVQAVAAGRTRSGLECLVMNFIEGRTLDTLWDAQSPSSSSVDGTPVGEPASMGARPDDHLRLFKTICETVQAAHLKGITHRDLSPSNILIDHHGQPHILDFGMASTAFDKLVGGGRNVTVTGQFIGKLKYASPEQARAAGTSGDAVDIRSDVYALGVMLYQLLTNGAFPYEVVGNVIDVLHNIIHSTPKPPSQAMCGTAFGRTALQSGGTVPFGAADLRRNPPLINETIEAVVLKALEKDPSKRYQSAGELAADIGRYVAGQPTTAAIRTTHSLRSSRFNLRRRPKLIAASIFLIATLVGVTMNARTLAAWLGFAAVAAPVASSDLSLLAPQTAEAAALEAAQPEGGVAGLKRLAEDLARVEAKLLAVNRQLDAVASLKSPELDRAAVPPAAPLGFEAFIAKLGANTEASGKSLVIDVISAAEFDQQVKDEADAISGELDREALIALRQSLDVEQASLWARLAFGSFAARDIGEQPIYTYKLKAVPVPSEDATAAAFRKGHVLESGIKAVRWIDLALRDASSTLKHIGSEDAQRDVGEVTDAVRQQVDQPLTQLRIAVNSADAASGLSDSEMAVCRQLGEQAQVVRDSFGGIKDLAERVSRATSEPERSRRRSELQKELIAAADGASRLDASLAAAVKEWKVEVDSAKLGALKTMVAKPRQEPIRPTTNQSKTHGVADLFPINSKWSGTYVNDGNAVNGRSATARVLRHDGNTVVMEVQVVGYALRHKYIEVNGSKLTLWKDEGVSAIQENGAPPNKFSAISISGDMADGTLTLAGTCNVSSAAGKFLLTERGTLTLRQEGIRADPLESWSVGSRWVTKNRGGGDTIWTVRSRDGDQLEIERPSVQGKGTVVVRLKIEGSRSVSVTQVRHENTDPVLNRDWNGRGTISAKSLKLTFSVESKGGRNPWDRWSETLDLKPE